MELLFLIGLIWPFLKKLEKLLEVRKKSNKDFWSNVLYLAVLKIKLLILLTLKSDNAFNLLHVKIVHRFLTLIDNFGHFIFGQNLKSVATLSSIITSKSVGLDFIY